jgi:hypothetical protein
MPSIIMPSATGKNTLLKSSAVVKLD